METKRRPVRINTFRRKTQTQAQPTHIAWLFPVIAVLALSAMAFLGVAIETLTSSAALTGFIGLVWAGWCNRIKAWRSQSLTLLTTLGAFSLGLIGAASLAAITLNTVDIAIMVASLALLMGWAYKSTPLLLSSILALAVWLLATIPAANAFFGFGEIWSVGWLLALPALVIGQISLATKLRSSVCTLLTIALAYSWGLWLGLAAAIPVAALAGLGFAIAFAHHRAGKSMKDTRIHGASIHNWAGMTATLITALLLQSIWLDPTMNAAVPGWIPTQLWWVGFGLASLALFVSSLLRFKQTRITLSGIFILSFAAAILPMASIRPDLVRDTLSAFPGLNPAPAFGLMIGAAIMAAGLAWVIKGVRQLKLGYVVIGATLVGIESVMLLTPGRANLDTVIIFIGSLVAALCIGGLVAGGSLDHTVPGKRVVTNR